MSDFPRLETQRLVLREIVAADAAAIFSIHGDANVMRYFGADPMSEPDQAVALIETFTRWRDEENSGIRWGIEQNGQLIGTCGLFRWNHAWHSAMVGYELAQSTWGQGFMQEALVSILSYGFTAMDLNRIEAQIHPNNTASLKLMPKLGFTHEGQLREVGFWGGQFHDFVQFGLLKREFAG
ncbi:GNAT family N-acetyltransferase [Deefgea tanakiae]|uniref:GNAT family N-acetyltransferase n=1 Tax=Deefgea tanakiae TaxID=2865840 RepID=A0ABX8Z4L2_9NEIS|nr:GNAT family protein [Deefgea tanakiae]QZA77508.1 GNAT family N-acetyltransferase [Deefgea tanakiae]